MKATYHDPCHLGRYTGVYNSPRSIIDALPGVEFKEMARNMENAFCCGGGGGVRTAFFEYAVDTAKHRLEEASEYTGCSNVITACPFCEQNIGEAAKGTDFKVIDINQLVLNAI